MAFNHALGIDFGTDTIKICDKKNRITVCEKNMIAIRQATLKELYVVCER